MFQLSASTYTEVDPIVFNNLEEVEHSLSASSGNGLMHAVDSGAVGRPSLVLPLDAVENYLLAGVSVRDIATLFGVGERTIRRRMADHGIR